MVPAFEGIAEDAERATKAEYERLGAMPYGDQIDMSDVAEMANDHGIAYYETMSGVRQGVLNVLAVGLYHLFEQQQLFFLRRGLLSRAEDVPVPDFIYTPLAGEDLYVSERDLSEWCDAAIAFWEKLSAILDDHQRRQSVG